MQYVIDSLQFVINSEKLAVKQNQFARIRFHLFQNAGKTECFAGTVLQTRQRGFRQADGGADLAFHRIGTGNFRNLKRSLDRGSSAQNEVGAEGVRRTQNSAPFHTNTFCIRKELPLLLAGKR